MKPVISANMRPGQAALRASRICPSYSITAASTGVGLFQCVKSQAGQRSRAFSPPSSICATTDKGVAQRGQKRYSCVMKAARYY